MEGRRKLKFGEVSFQICLKFLRENPAKKTSALNVLLNLVCSVQHRLSKCSVRSPRALQEKPKGSTCYSFTFLF